jgi:hypothetical protein
MNDPAIKRVVGEALGKLSMVLPAQTPAGPAPFVEKTVKKRCQFRIDMAMSILN